MHRAFAQGICVTGWVASDSMAEGMPQGETGEVVGQTGVGYFWLTLTLLNSDERWFPWEAFQDTLGQVRKALCPSPTNTCGTLECVTSLHEGRDWILFRSAGNPA